MPRLFGRKCYFRVKERGNTVTGFSVLSVREESAGKRGSRRKDSAREFPELSAGLASNPWISRKFTSGPLHWKAVTPANLSCTRQTRVFPAIYHFVSAFLSSFALWSFVELSSRGQVVTNDDPQRTNYDVRRLASLVKDLWLRKKTSRFSPRQTK